MNPVEKPIISGAASGATIEGLEDLMMSEPYDSEDCPLCLEKIDFIEAYEELPNDLCEGCSDAAIEVARGDELIAGLEQGEEGKELRGVTRGRGHGAASALEAGDAFLEHPNYLR